MASGDSSVTSGNDVAEMLAAYVEHSPFAVHLGLRSEVVESDNRRHVRYGAGGDDQLVVADRFGLVVA